MKSLNKDLWSIKYKPSIKEQFIFETKSLIGRLFRRQNKNKAFKTYLNVGSGTNIYENFTNLDFYSGFKFWKKYSARPDWEADLRYPLRCEDAVFEGVFSEHTLEHLTYSEVANLLSELHRIMKPNSTLRLIVPDVEITLRECKDPSNADFARKIWDIAQNWGHHSVWNFGMLKLALENAGFVDVSRFRFGTGMNADLIKDTKSRSSVSLYVEATKL